MNKDCCLRYYNPNLAVFIESDASKVGLGAALLQTEKPCYENDITDDTLLESFQLKPVAYASKSLTTAEQNYSNIEHEALGLLHSLEKFHHYCYAQGCEQCKSKIAKITITNSQISWHDALQAWQGDAPCRLPIKRQSQAEPGQ